ncbi:MAG: hypothetical protein NT150_06680 [Bacteroidetes bacterium]|nr:hypothetical protein [Bacteroidota bacterium]
MSEEKKENKFLQNILQNLKAKNNGLVLKALQDAKQRGTIHVLPGIIEALLQTEDDTVYDEAKGILFELKASKAGEIIIDYLKKDISAGHRDVLVSALWQSSIPSEEYISFLIDLACKENFMTTLEVLTVVENMEGNVNDDEITDCISTVNECIENGGDAEKMKLLLSLVEVLELLRP